MSATGTVERVWLRASLFGQPARAWADLDTADPEVAACIDRGLILRHGPDGEPPPEHLPRRGCGCGH